MELSILLKSGACLAVFMLFYKLVLERLSIHKFKRYYLLTAIIISLAIPFITFYNYVEPVVLDVAETVFVPQNFSQPDLNMEIPETPINYLPIVLWSIYGLGVLVFGIKFILNISGILKEISVNEKHKTNHFTSVLINKVTIPHTFFSYIFFNKKDYSEHKIPKEVLLHEATHAKQKHSLDVVFVELLQVVFWFNPLLYFIKKDIRLNHEFLADTAVLQEGVDTKIYQNILLDYSISQPQHSLANAINYPTLKKRFTLMKTKSTKTAILLRTLLIAPVLAVLVYGFSTTKTVELEQSTDQEISKPLMLKPISGQPTENDLKQWNKQTFHTIWLDGKQILNNELDSELIKDVYHYTISFVPKNTSGDKFQQANQLYLYTKKGFENVSNGSEAKEIDKQTEDLKTGFITINNENHYFVTYKEATRYFNSKGIEVNLKGLEVNGSKQVKATDVIPGNYISKIYKDDKVVIQFFENENPYKDLPENKINSITDNFITLYVNQKPFGLKLLGNKTTLETLKNDLKVVPYKLESIYLHLAQDSIPMPLITKVKKATGLSGVKLKLKKGYIVGKTSQDSFTKDVNKTYTLDITKNPLILEGKQTTYETLKSDFKKLSKGIRANLEIENNGETVKYSELERISTILGVDVESISSKNGTDSKGDNASMENPWKVSYNVEAVEVTEIDTNAKNPWAINVGEAKEIKFTSGVLSKYKSKLTVNGIPCQEECFFNFTKKQVEGLILGNVNGEKVTSFIIKVPGESSVVVRGHKISKKAIDLIKAANVGTVIQLFNIKSGKAKFKPVLITLVSNNSKLIDNSPKLNKGEKSNILPPPMPPKPNTAVNGKKVSANIITDPKKINEAKKNSQTVESIKKLKGDSNGIVLINNKTCYYNKKGNNITYFNRWGNLIDENGEETTTSNGQGYVKKGEKSNIPPPPIPTLSPKESHKIKTYVDHLKKEKFKNTKIFYKNQEISKAKALKLVKSSPLINLATEEQPNGSFIILISREGDIKRGNPVPSKVSKIKSAHSFTFSTLKNAKKIEWDSKLKDVFKDLNNNDQIMVVVEIEERVVLNNTIIENFSTKLKGTAGEIDTIYKKIQEIMSSLKPAK